MDSSEKKVCHLKKSLYGLKQASRQWFSKLLQELLTQGFIQSKNDCSFFFKKQGSSTTFLVVYVDNILITGNDAAAILAIKSHLDKVFSNKDHGLLHYFLGMEVSHFSDGMVITQQKFTKELLQSSGLIDFRKALTPLPVNLKLSASEGTLLSDPTSYRSIVGKLNFLTNTRPDLSYTV